MAIAKLMCSLAPVNEETSFKLILHLSVHSYQLPVAAYFQLSLHITYPIWVIHQGEMEDAGDVCPPSVKQK